MGSISASTSRSCTKETSRTGRGLPLSGGNGRSGARSGRRKASPPGTPRAGSASPGSRSTKRNAGPSVGTPRECASGSPTSSFWGSAGAPRGGGGAPAAPAGGGRRGGIAGFSGPPNVGGSYSFLSAVGLLPLAAAGVFTERLLAGARWMETVFRGLQGGEDPVLAGGPLLPPPRG